MNYEDKDLEGKLEEDLQILERLREEGHKIIEPKTEKFLMLPTADRQNKIAQVNKNFIEIFTEKINALKNSSDAYEDDYEITKEEEKKLEEFEDPINRMDRAVKTLVRSNNNNDGILKIALLLATTTMILGVIIALLLLK